MRATIDPEAGFHVEPADYATDFEALRRVRETVFVQEQNVPLEEEWDELDPRCHHVLARDVAGHPIGTGRLTPERKIGRMAVMKDWRGKGVGEAIMHALLDRARALGWPEVSLHAQVAAMGFYDKFGFEPYGERFDEAGIEHQAMRLALTPAEAVPRALSDLPPSETPQPIETADEAAAALIRMLPLARSQIRIYTRDLDPLLFGRPDVLDALRRFATEHRGALVRVLVQDPANAQLRHHPLLALAQRLSSAFRFRSPIEPQDEHYPAAFIATDRGGFLYRPIGSRFEGEASACTPSRARQLAALFDPLWERSRDCGEFRALGI